MLRKVIPFFFTLLFCCLGASVQFDTTRDGRPRPEETPQNIKETLAKQRIEQEKKEYEELLSRSEEAVKLSEDLEKTFAESKEISSETLKKLEKLEKLVKKIRDDLGGDDDDEKSEVEEETKPTSVEIAFKKLQEAAVKLYTEVKRSSRYSISVIAIQSSNAVLKIVRFLRFGK